MSRWFNDMDVRLTNTSIENVKLTGYGKIYNEERGDAQRGRGARHLDAPYFNKTTDTRL